jgi:hypothetical protein
MASGAQSGDERSRGAALALEKTTNMAARNNSRDIFICEHA